MHALVTAWTSFLLRGQPAHFDERLFIAKPHPGAIRYAGWVREGLTCSPRPPLGAGKIIEQHRRHLNRVRCRRQIKQRAIDIKKQTDLPWVQIHRVQRAYTPETL